MKVKTVMRRMISKLVIIMSLALPMPGFAQGATDILARDSNTQTTDIELTNACIISGQSKGDCVCITRIFKYHMTVAEYDKAMSLFEDGATENPIDMTVLKISLKRQGYSDQEITAIDNMQRTLSHAEEFQQTCQEATDYFDAVKTQ